MDCCALGPLRLFFPGYLRVALLWFVHIGAWAQQGEWIEDLVVSHMSVFLNAKRDLTSFVFFAA